MFVHAAILPQIVPPLASSSSLSQLLKQRNQEHRIGPGVDAAAPSGRAEAFDHLNWLFRMWCCLYFCTGVVTMVCPCLRYAHAVESQSTWRPHTLPASRQGQQRQTAWQGA
eukprot:4622432-Karenia_brevis.AAC.1